LRRLSCNLDHSGGLITSQLDHGDRVERLKVDELETDISRERYHSGSDLRDKVLVTELNTGKSGFSDGSIVSLLVILDDGYHLVRSSVLTGKEELESIGGLESEPLAGIDSVSLSIPSARTEATFS
jgi:hypothetical protein